MSNEEMWIQNSVLYNALFSLGQVIPLNFKINHFHCRQELIQWKDSWQVYNPRTPKNNRFGLPYTSIDGEVIDPVSLDSLRQYNTEHGTNYNEHDFKLFTSVADTTPSLESIKSFFDGYIRRSHFLRLDAGGFFPPHRDSQRFMDFRVIVPIKFDKAVHYFLINDVPIHFDEGNVYIVNTAQNHVVFSCSDSMILLVLNIALNNNSLYKCIRNTMSV
jgi:hypothetical protein